MNRVEFMTQLESLLQNISPAEREEALQYYNDYFDDAGPENEADVLEALGTPAKIAESIKKDLSGSAGEPVYGRAPGNKNAVAQYQETEERRTEPEPPAEKKEPLPAWAIVLIVILCIICSPVILGVCGGLLGVLISVVATWFAVIFAFGVMALGLFIALLVMVIVGGMCCFVSPLTGLALIGSGLVCAGVGLLFLMLTVALSAIVTPAIGKGIVHLWKSIFGKKEAAK